MIYKGGYFRIADDSATVEQTGLLGFSILASAKITLPSPRDGNFNIAAGNNFNGGAIRQFHCECSEQFHRLRKPTMSSSPVERLMVAWSL
jgi:hypothetical protein